MRWISRLSLTVTVAVIAVTAKDRPTYGGVTAPGITVPVEEVVREEGLPRDQVHFDGYTVYRLLPQEPSQLQYIASLENEEDTPYDFWKHPSDVGHYVDINVSPSKKENFEKEIEKRNITSAVLIEDLEQEIRNVTSQGPNPEDPTDRNQQNFFLDYRSYGQMAKYMDQLVYKYNSKEKGLLVKKHKIGLSTEKRDLYVFEITTASQVPKKSIWLDSGMHAREWIAPPTVFYIMEELLKGYKQDENTTNILDHFTIYTMPMVNPDGYEYSRTTWGTAGASTNCAMDTYAGPSAFSEPETRALSDFIYIRRQDMLAYLTFHAYSQLWMTPWGYTNALPPNYNRMMELADKATRALTKVHGTRYRTGSSTNLLYAASGGSDDWAHGVAMIPYSYTIELRDDGRYGFILPTSHIIPTGEETWAGVKVLLQELISRKHHTTTPSAYQRQIVSHWWDSEVYHAFVDVHLFEDRKFNAVLNAKGWVVRWILCQVAWELARQSLNGSAATKRSHEIFFSGLVTLNGDIYAHVRVESPLSDGVNQRRPVTSTFNGNFVL
ncbi:carboxypeptidase A2-like [Tropilaelaps mercedesae]|uniref:Zinc carboxypeptidase A 1 n=1 Tax=Tropilaelaps mercedesae TaxID=418985 RepID=A0A1V9X8J6_9ACAR|nr:carboxypeptidase A2-like [Tropilaelaps mercedesae]